MVVFKRRLPTMNVAADVDDDGSIRCLQQQLRDKDLRLTDVRLEALTSAHRLHQMQDAVKRLKACIITLWPVYITGARPGYYVWGEAGARSWRARELEPI